MDAEVVEVLLDPAPDPEVVLPAEHVPSPRGDLHVSRHDDAAAHQLPHVQLVDVSGEENNTKSKWSI